MAYTPTEWQCGDVLTAEKLNKLENGLADCCGAGTEPLVVNILTDEINNIIYFDKTFGEVKTAFENGQTIITVKHQYNDNQYSESNRYIKRLVSGVKYDTYIDKEDSTQSGAFGEVEVAGDTAYTVTVMSSTPTLDMLNNEHPAMAS